MTVQIYYIKIGKLSEFVHFETEGRERKKLSEFLANKFLPGEKESADRTAKVRCYELPHFESGDENASPNTVKLGMDKSSGQFILNGINVGGFR